jgi:transaldolase
MGASFRNVGQILELAGCDLLTISPELMKQLSQSHEPVERKLNAEKAKSADVQRLELDEKKFRYLLNDDGEDRGRYSQVCRGYCEAGEIRREQA